MELRPIIATVNVVSCIGSVVLLVWVCGWAQRGDLRLRAYSAAIATALGPIAALIAWPAQWSRACAVLALLLAAQAAAIVFALGRPLAAYVDDAEPHGEPSWWASFEREFWVYALRAE